MTRPEPSPARRALDGVQIQTPRPPGDSDSPAGAATTGTPRRQWRIEFPPGMKLLTSNHRSKHWAPAYKITSVIKDTALVLARKAKIPRLHRVAFVIEFRPPPGRRRVVHEVHNLAPAAKAAIDGVTQAGVIRDDSDKYVAEVTFRPGRPPHPPGQFVLIITELPETPEDTP